MPRKIMIDGGFQRLYRKRASSPYPLSGLRQLLFSTTSGFAAGSTIYDTKSDNGDDRPAQPSRALTLNGTDEYGTFATQTFSGEFCLFGWLKTNNTSGIRQIFGFSSGDSNIVRLDAGYFKVGTSSRAATIAADGAWHPFMVYRDASGDFYCYQDGVDITTTVYNNTAFLVLDQIGRTFNGSLDRYWEGQLFDLGIMERVPTASEIAAHASGLWSPEDNLLSQWHLEDNSTTIAYDSSGNGNHLTLANAPTIYEGKDVPYSYANEVGYTEGVNMLPYAACNDGLGWADIASTSTNLALNVLDKFSGVSVATNGETWHRLYGAELLSVVSGQPYVITTFYRAGTSGQVRLHFENTAGGSSAVSILAGPVNDPVNTASLAGALTRLSLELLDDGLTYKIVALFTPNFTGDTFRYNIGPNSSTVGQTIIALGMQIESGTTATDFELTNGSASAGLLIPRDESNPTLDIFGNTLEYAGKAPLPAALHSSNCLTLNGTDQYVDTEVPSDTFDTEGVFFCEFRPDAVSGTLQGKFRLITSRSGTASRLSLAIDDSKVVIAYIASSTLILSPGVEVAINDTVKACIRKTSTKLQLFVNGVLIDDITSTVASAGTETIRIGAGVAASFDRGFDGSMWNIQLYDTELTQEQCEQLTTDGIPPVTPHTHIPCSEGAGPNVYDKVSEAALPIVNAGSNWSVLQDVYHHNFYEGFSDPKLLAGDELITNGTFDTNITNWTATGAAVISWDSEGKLLYERTVNAADNVTQAITTEIGKIYYISVNADDVSGEGVPTLRVGPTAGSASIGLFNVVDGVGIGWFTAIGTTTYIGGGRSGNGIVKFDNFTCKEIPAHPDAKIPPSAADPFVDVVAGLPLTNPSSRFYEGFDTYLQLDSTDDRMQSPAANYSPTEDIKRWVLVFKPNGQVTSASTSANDGAGYIININTLYGGAYVTLGSATSFLTNETIAVSTTNTSGSNGWRGWASGTVTEEWHTLIGTWDESISNYALNYDGVDLTTTSGGVSNGVPWRYVKVAFNAFINGGATTGAAFRYAAFENAAGDKLAEWKFSEGEGTAVIDNVTGDALTVINATDPWRIAMADTDGTSALYDGPVNHPATSFDAGFHNGAETLVDFTGGVNLPNSVDWEVDWAFNDARTNPLFSRTITQDSADYRADRMPAYNNALSGSDLTKAQLYTATKEI